MISFGVSEKKHQALLDRMAGCNLREQDIEESFVRSSGPGGQRVNKTSSCVLLKHPPTGLSVKMQKSRAQRLNRYYARRRLCELIEQQQLGNASPREKKQARIRKQKQRRSRRHRDKAMDRQLQQQRDERDPPPPKSPSETEPEAS